MKFKINKSTPTFKKLEQFYKEMRTCNEKAKQIAIHVGAKKWAYKFGVLAGGISAFELPEKPTGWKADPYYTGFYFPIRNRKFNQQLLSEIDALPIVTHDDLNKIVKFNQQDSERGDGRFTMHLSPGVSMHGNYALLEIDERCNFKPSADMKEITSSEYFRLKKKKDSHHKK